MPHSSSITKEDFTEVAAEGSLYECKPSPELIAAFEKKATKVVCSNDEILFRDGEHGDCIYLVLAGEVALLLPLTSTDVMGFRAQSGSFLGLPAAFSLEPFSMTAIGWEGTELAVMSRDRFKDLIGTSPTLALDVLKILAAEARAARAAIAHAVPVEPSQRKS